MVDKNQAMIDYLLKCPDIKNSPLFFNFGKTKQDNNQFVTIANDEALNTKYIDGSISKSYRFILLTYKTISYNAIVKTGNFQDENLSEMAEFQKVIDWVKEQEELCNYPDFGNDCVIDSIKSLSELKHILLILFCSSINLLNNIDLSLGILDIILNKSS